MIEIKRSKPAPIPTPICISICEKKTPEAPSDYIKHGCPVNQCGISGQAKAISQGSAHITFEGHGLKLQTKATVLLGNTIYVDSPRETLTNVNVPAEGYSFPVKFKESKFVKGNMAIFNCQVDPPFIRYANPWIDLDTGDTSCLFFPYSLEHLVHSMSRSKDTKPLISFSINASVKEGRHVSGSASALLIGGFSVKWPIKLNVNPDSNKTTISILGNTGTWSHVSAP